MQKKVFLLAVVIALFTFTLAFAQPPDQEEITLSTYYPAPYGEYDKLSSERLLVWRPDADELQAMREGDCHIGWSLIVGTGGSGFSYDEIGIGLGDGDAIIKGNVGIGMTGPGARLESAGYDQNLLRLSLSTSPDSYYLNVANMVGVNTVDYRIQTKDFTGGTRDMLYFDSSGGNLGIGTTDPGSTLDLNGALTVRGMPEPAKAPADQGRIYFDSTSNKFRVSEGGADYVDFGASGTYWAVTAVGDHIYNINTGNVGIATTNPGSALDLNGAFSVRGMPEPAKAPANQGRIYFDSASNKFRVSDNGGNYVNLGVSKGGAAGTWNHSGAQVFSGIPPTSWTDLDLSSYVGSNRALVLLKFKVANPNDLAIRPNGDTDEYFGTTSLYSGGVVMCNLFGSSLPCSMVFTKTDANGVIEWIARYNLYTVTVYLVGYIKME